MVGGRGTACWVCYESAAPQPPICTAPSGQPHRPPPTPPTHHPNPHRRAHKADAGAVLEVPAEAGARVRQAAQPFIDWLEQDTESESDEDESDDEYGPP